MPYSRVSFRMTLSNIEKRCEIFSDTKHRTASLQQLSFLLFLYKYIFDRLDHCDLLLLAVICADITMHDGLRQHPAPLANYRPVCQQSRSQGLLLRGTRSSPAVAVINQSIKMFICKAPLKQCSQRRLLEVCTLKKPCL